MARFVVCNRCLKKFEVPADVAACLCPLCGSTWCDERFTAGRRGSLLQDVGRRPRAEPAADAASLSIESSRWQRVAVGFDLLFWGWFGLFVLPLMAGIAAALAQAEAGPPLVAIVGVYLLPGSSMLAGMVFCCQAPEESGATWPARCALGVGLASIVFAGLVIAVAAFGGGLIRLHDDAVEMTMLGCWLLAGLGGLVALFAWLLFLRRVALYFNSRLLAGHVTAYSVAWASGIGGTAVLVWVVRVVPQLDWIGIMPTVFSCLILYPWQLYLLQRLRYLVRESHITPAPADESATPSRH